MSTKRVLIVEDDKDLSNIYSIILKHAGYDVCVAYNGKEALKQINECQPGLVLLDIFMPVMDGKTFLQNVSLNDYPGMKMVVCSNTSDPKLMEEMLELGADKVVTKSTMEPSDLEALVALYFS